MNGDRLRILHAHIAGTSSRVSSTSAGLYARVGLKFQPVQLNRSRNLLITATITAREFAGVTGTALRIIKMKRLSNIAGILLAGLLFNFLLNTTGPTVTYTATPKIIETVEAHEPTPAIYVIPPVESLAVVSEIVPHEIVRASVSAYTSSPDETDDTPEINARGTKPGPGSIACPTRYPFGTEVIIKDESYFCDDRMNPRYADGNYFDIWMESKAEAIHWGRRTIDAQVVQ